VRKPLKYRKDYAKKERASGKQSLGKKFLGKLCFATVAGKHIGEK